MQAVGVDRCSDGWVAACWGVEAGTIALAIHPSLASVIGEYEEAGAIGIDMPIGLSETGTRACDVEARQLLGRPRASSVFPPPVPGILHAPTYEDAMTMSRARIGKAVSLQCFALFRKLAEARETVMPAMQDRVVEVHPEVSFWALAGRPMQHHKDEQGYAERRALLERATGLTLPSREAAFDWARPAKPDDVLDALVAAWTARRVVEGEAKWLPAVPEADAAGLRMEIVY